MSSTKLSAILRSWSSSSSSCLICWSLLTETGTDKHSSVTEHVFLTWNLIQEGNLNHWTCCSRSIKECSSGNNVPWVELTKKNTIQNCIQCAITSNSTVHCVHVLTLVFEWKAHQWNFALVHSEFSTVI